MVCVSRVAYKQANETSYDLFPQRKYLQSGTRRGAHVKGAGSGIDLERDGGGARARGHGARGRGAGRVLRRLPYVRAQRVWHPVCQHSPTLINKTTAIDSLHPRYHRLLSLINLLWHPKSRFLIHIDRLNNRRDLNVHNNTFIIFHAMLELGVFFDRSFFSTNIFSCFIIII